MACWGILALDELCCADWWAENSPGLVMGGVKGYIWYDEIGAMERRYYDGRQVFRGTKQNRYKGK